jgi:acyl carrier protein
MAFLGSASHLLSPLGESLMNLLNAEEVEECAVMELDVKERLKTMIVEITGNESLSGNISDATDLINGVGLDSIQMVNLILMIEDEFSIEIDFENFNIENLKSIENFSQFITDLKG